MQFCSVISFNVSAVFCYKSFLSEYVMVDLACIFCRTFMIFVCTDTKYMHQSVEVLKDCELKFLLNMSFNLDYNSLYCVLDQ